MSDVNSRIIRPESKVTPDVAKLTTFELEKWTGCLIQGPTLSKEWAERICLQTSSFYLFTNSKHLLKEYYDVLKIGYKERGHPYDHDYYVYESDDKRIKELTKSCNLIEDIHYLTNSSICSASLGNPNWIHWDGTIKKCANLGKWPSAQNIYDEWRVIAKRFPILKLTCQLLNGELSYGNVDELEPIIQFNIDNGKVDIQFDGITKLNLKQRTVEEDVYGHFFGGSTYSQECLIKPLELAKVVERVEKWIKESA